MGINYAILLNAFLLRLVKISKVDTAVYILLSVFYLFMPSTSTSFDVMTMIFTNPATILLISYAMASEGTYKRKSLDDGEYMALLFCRPVTRASYILTKWVAASLSVLWVVFFNVGIYILIRTVKGDYTCLASLNGWDVVNLVFNAFSFSAMMMFVRSLPIKVSIWLFLSMVYLSAFISVGVGGSESSGATDQMANTLYSVREAISMVIGQFLFPSIDVQGALNTTKFSILPFITYLSNISFYLLLATMILCKRQFSYSLDD